MRACIFLNGQINDYDLIKQKVKNYDLIIVSTANEEWAEKIKYLSKIIPKFIIEDNIKIGILNSIISINIIIKMIINKQIEINKLKNLSKEQNNIKIKNIKNIIKSNLYLNYATETTTGEIIEKCKFLKNEKKRDFVIISNANKIKDFNEENKYKFYNELEKLSQQIELTIMII